MLPKDTNISSGNYSGQDPLKEFQLEKLTVTQKTDKQFGIELSRKIWGYVTSGIGGYYYSRNQQFLKNRNFANGIIDVQAMFQDRFEMNGKQNYMRLVWQTLQMVNRIISGLVGRWMERDEKIQVIATDPISIKQKQEQYDQIEFFIEAKEKLEKIQEQSGVQMIPSNEELPADKEQLMLWKNEFQRIPEEIETELGCNDILSANGFYGANKEKMLHDSAEVGFLGTHTGMDENGVIKVRWVKPENSIYSYSEYSDFRDTSWRGELPTFKISELRRDYGKEFNPNNPNALTEEQLWRIAQGSKDWTYYTNIQFDNLWLNAFTRPYDEYNVRGIIFELKSVDTDPYTVTTTKNSGTTYVQKGMPTTSNGKLREKPSDNQKIIGDTNWNIYRSVYLPDNDMLLEWGLKKNMIRPQDPKEVGNAEFSYSFYMYQNFQMRNMAIPQKIEAAVDGMMLACLKIQQVVARLVPPGWVIDESKLNNIDYGTGDANNPVQHSKVFFQTGLMYHNGMNADGTPNPEPPIKELVNNGFVGQMEGLVKNYQFWYQTLKDELGEDPNLIQAATQPRVTTGNVDVAKQQAQYATDYMYRAYAYCMEDTSRKISCLLKDSITYGSKVYRDIIKQEDMPNRVYNTSIQFLPDATERTTFEAVLNQAVNTNPELVMFVNPLQLIRIAKQDVKLAESAFRQGQKKMLVWKQQTAEQNQKATFDAQNQSVITGETEKRKTMQMEVSGKGQVEMALSKEKQKEIILTGIFSVYAKGVPMPAELQGLTKEMIQNVGLPLFAENASMVSNAINSQQSEEGAEQVPDNEQSEPQEQNLQPQQEQAA